MGFNTKQFSIITLLISIFLVLHILATSSFAQKTEEVNPLNLETLLGETTSTPGVMSGNMKFQYEMAELLSEKVGSDDSGNVHHLGGLSSFYTGPEKLFPGKGAYGNLYSFLPLIRWYDPEYYYNSDIFHPGSTIDGEFTNRECVTCHMVESPGIVTQWKQSKHGTPSSGKDIVGCDRCHGKNHKRLKMPSYDLCGECHEKQLQGHRQSGQGSHANAYHFELIELGVKQRNPPKRQLPASVAMLLRTDVMAVIPGTDFLRQRLENQTVVRSVTPVLSNTSMRCICNHTMV